MRPELVPSGWPWGAYVKVNQVIHEVIPAKNIHQGGFMGPGLHEDRVLIRGDDPAESIRGEGNRGPCLEQEFPDPVAWGVGPEGGANEAMVKGLTMSLEESK